MFSRYLWTINKRCRVIFIIFIIPIVLFFIFLFYLYKKKKAKYLAQDYSEILPKESTYEYVPSEEVHRLKLNDIEDKIYEGEKLVKHKVDSLYLLHGTFVGDDPFHIIGLIKRTFPKLGDKFIGKFKEQTKKGQNLFAKDIGNFVDTHEHIIEKMVNNNLTVNNFTWSSGNHHYARIEGMFKLIEQLNEKQNSGDRVMLIGHSHAGQIFALLSQLLKNKQFQKDLFEIFSPQIDKNIIKKSLLKIQSMKLDFVTFGTPARYRWELSKQMRLIHFINHRSKDLYGGAPSGAVFTKSGDYIQQWGVSGSDMISPIVHEKVINERLDLILGKGANIELLKENISLRKRLHNQGHHYLVNYNDASKYPNFFKTIFGHGGYTKFEHLRFHFNFINKRFYK